MEYWRNIIRAQKIDDVQNYLIVLTVGNIFSRIIPPCIPNFLFGRFEPLNSYTRKTLIFKIFMNTGPSSRSNVERQTLLANNMEEIMVKVSHNYVSFDMKLIVLILSSQIAKLDCFMRSRTGAWAP